ncbi:hypothetical protein [Streptomyces uncialis]|uniref:Uncharacterized protein n=1 Tax=Streptomyces uncialis TaxID=1048205 RepID=A0A1Q4VAT0_9ACTN|nr:hypothetical protein [Streptomyces uncialis]OKH94810.1 hypothetical protein AB852_11560 [Streptomyces uncialis]
MAGAVGEGLGQPAVDRSGVVVAALDQDVAGGLRPGERRRVLPGSAQGRRQAGGSPATGSLGRPVAGNVGLARRLPWPG